MADSASILIVEDNDFVRMQTATFLKEAGYTVLEAANGKDAEAHLHPAPDLAIVDVLMEPVGGFEFLRHMRGMDLETPALLMTGDRNHDILQESGKLGVLAVMLKPVPKDRLLQMVSRALQKARQ